MSQKKSIGFIFTFIAAALSLVACIVYTKVMYTLPAVYVFLILAIVVTIALVVVSKGDSILQDFLPILGAIFNAAAAGAGFYLMVNQLGYVVAGLDGVDTIQSFIVFEVFAILAMIVSIVGNFLPLKKEA